MKGKMMSETKWTPGPYTCDPMPGPHQPRIEGGGKLIAVVGNAENWVEAKAEWEANAQLFTAAPDLYEALEGMVEPWDGFSEFEMRRRVDPPRADAIMKARTALAKARILAALEPAPTPDAREKEAAAWKPIESAPRDGRWVWLWNKHCEDKTLAPQAYRWSTHYSVFGLGGCWTDGLATMGDKIDFDFWCEFLPANFVDPYADETRTTGGDDD